MSIHGEKRIYPIYHPPSVWSLAHRTHGKVSQWGYCDGDHLIARVESGAWISFVAQAQMFSSSTRGGSKSLLSSRSMATYERKASYVSCLAKTESLRYYYITVVSYHS